jgi:calcineurin-like phosphoesterase family protein
MNDTLVKNINSVVHENDLLYHLGDWSFGGHDQIDEFRLRINCKNIILILGNHDQHIRRTNSNKRLLFSEVHMQYECHQYGYDFVMSHYPIDVWNGKSEGAFHLFGHVHGNLERTDRSMDVGVDTNDMKPYNLETIIKILEPRL